MSKRRKNKNNKKKNSKKNNHNNSKRKIEVIEEKTKKPSFGKKAGLAFLVTSLVTAGGFLICDSKPEEKRPRQASQAKLRDLREIYDGWMAHYNPKGLGIDYVRENSSTVQTLFKKIKANPEKAVEITKIDSFFFSKLIKYEEFPSEYAMMPYCTNFSEKLVNDLYQKIASEGNFRGLDEVLDVIQKNTKNMQNFDDTALSSWLLNAAYFIARKNFKSGVKTFDSKEELYIALKNSEGNCEIISNFTKNMYLSLLRVVSAMIKTDRTHLCKKVSSITGFSLTKDKENTPSCGHAWLVYYDKNGKEIINETNSAIDDKLFTEKFNPKKVYIKGQSKNLFYVPLIRTNMVPIGNLNVRYEKRLLILPKQIEEEIKQH